MSGLEVSGIFPFTIKGVNLNKLGPGSAFTPQATATANDLNNVEVSPNVAVVVPDLEPSLPADAPD
jgi:hypothetical protein